MQLEETGIINARVDATNLIWFSLMNK